MKIISFNVNGLRSIVNKGLNKYIIESNADIFSLNETKLSDNNLYNSLFDPYILDNYNIYSTISKVRKGYSGVMVLSKLKPLNIHYGLDNNNYDDEGRVITLEFDKFFYIAAYVPNAGENLKRLDYRLNYEKDLIKYINRLNAIKPIIYGGDLNVAHNEIDLTNPKSNINNPGFTIYERNAFTNLLGNGYIDTFRYLYPNTIKYSWFSYRFNARSKNIGWRIDYFVVSKVLKDNIIDSIINNTIEGSDHTPIELIINI